jgi:ABC-type transporter Mla subunit MlaD
MLVERNDAKVGLFVMAGLGLFVGLFVLVNARKVVEHTDRIKVRLESLEGVAVGTEVVLQGYRVGQVDALEFKQEGVRYRFLATLSINDGVKLWRGTKVAVVPKGLGGSALDLQLPPEDQRSAELPRQEILEGEAGASFASILIKVDTLLENLGAVSGELRTKGAGYVLDQPQLRNVLQRLTATLQTYDGLGQDARRLAAQGGKSLEGLDRSLAMLESSLKEVQGLLQRHGTDLDETLSRLPKVLKQVEGLTGELQTLIKDERPDLEIALKSLNKDLKSVGELLELLKQKPSRILWGKPSEAERKKAEQSAAEGKPTQSK